MRVGENLQQVVYFSRKWRFPR